MGGFFPSDRSHLDHLSIPSIIALSPSGNHNVFWSTAEGALASGNMRFSALLDATSSTSLGCALLREEHKSTILRSTSNFLVSCLNFDVHQWTYDSRFFRNGVRESRWFF